ncbi:metalloendopeptidase [Virgibacillus profundi]|uniref:Metalloendopeptidase n=1 Tax=Virgibacillus profundi TaxID=2024555 RepID=A0A2A2IAW7_9BACI|nr:M23 family metallopeptidase [Virgibacillus profundi]PAV28203.1 metalloendopeptidase [Virgibacillus profundi]PXY52508.1 M23 family peptidase [Virgibacillus profundi]
MRKLIVGLSFISFFIIGLAACSGKNENSSKEPESGEKSSQEPVTQDELPDQFLEGNLEKIYNQTSKDFQDNVTLKQFKDLGVDFNKGVKNYEHVSEMPFQGLTEYQWVSDSGDKGIRSYFAKDLTIEGLQLMPISAYPESDKQYTENTYQMPITEDWFTFWGGTNELVNYHYVVESQRYAYDLVIVEGDVSFEGDPTDNESYYAFGKEVVAPLDGVVVSTENDISDNKPSVDTNEEKPLGNHVIIEHENNEYSVIAHLKKGSLEVSEGDEISAGDLLGLAGNSGNSSEPHIHFHVADGPDWKEASSIRIKLEGEADPVRGDIISGF